MATVYGGVYGCGHCWPQKHCCRGFSRIGKERFPTDGAEGERLYRITVPVKKDREYDIIELYEADERKDEFFHSITFGCGYENSEWFAQYTVTF